MEDLHDIRGATEAFLHELEHMGNVENIFESLAGKDAEKTDAVWCIGEGTTFSR